MKLELIRKWYGPNYTIGKLFIDGTYFSDTLEDVARKVKIPNETCIPGGTYKVIINMSTRFKRLMPLLLNVPNFEGIRIHNGTDQSNTSGCILVGNNAIIGKLVDSRQTFYRLFDILNAAFERGEEITIKIS